MIALLPFVALLAADVSPAPAAASPTPEPRAKARLQLRASEVWLGDGTRLEDALVIVEGGKIAKVGTDLPADPAQPLIEHDGVLTAGIVVCQTRSGAAGETFDSTRSVLPEARAAYAFDPDHSDFDAALRSGITSLVLTPSGNLVGGLTAVVSAGGRVTKKEAHLALSLSRDALSAGAVSQGFFFGDAGAAAAADGGPEDTAGGRRGARMPTSYSGALQVLDELFAHPAGPIARAKKGKLPVVIEAWDRNEVVRALRFAQGQGLRGAVRGAPLAGELADAFKAAGFGAILGPYRQGQTRASLESFAKLAAAGVPIGFALDAPSFDPRGLRLSAAMTITAGADPAAVWRALTSDAAQLAGVGERTGDIAAGRDADLVLWSGDPLELSSKVEAVYVRGELAFDGGSE